MRAKLFQDPSITFTCTPFGMLHAEKLVEAVLLYVFKIALSMSPLLLVGACVMFALFSLTKCIKNTKKKYYCF